MIRSKGAYLGYFRIMLICFLVSIFGNAQASNGPVVGVLSTKSPTYKGEFRTARGIRNVLLKVGAGKVVLLDYNRIISEFGGDLKGTAVEKGLSEILKEKGISRILIPGNYYNIVSEPLPPVPHRQIVTNAIVKLIKRNKNLKLLALCGGLQGVLHAQDIGIKRVEEMLSSEKMAEVHVASMPDPRVTGASLVRMKAVEGSKLAAMVKNVSGDLYFYMPDAHREAISIGEENKKRLRNLGYRISVVSTDGMIEGVEDRRGNMLLQMHPEYLLWDMEHKIGKDAVVDTSIEVAKEIFRDFLS